jgi:predicted O-methyltransferase YrrM
MDLGAHWEGAPPVGTDYLRPVITHTMRWSAEFAIPCVAPATGAVLRLLATATRARAVVEIGTGLGVSSLWLLDGLAPEAVLTSIDADPDLHAMARQAYAAAGHPSGRYRLLTGRAEVLLGRLADGAYDLVFVDITEQRPQWTDAAARLLRPGGLVVLHEPSDEDRDRLTAPHWTSAELRPELLAATRNQS